MSNLVLEYHYDRGNFNYRTKRWSVSRRLVPVLVEKETTVRLTPLFPIPILISPFLANPTWI